MSKGVWKTTYKAKKLHAREIRAELRAMLDKLKDQRRAIVLSEPMAMPSLPRNKILVGLNKDDEVVGRLEFSHGNNRRFNPDFFTKRQAKKELRANEAVSFVVIPMGA